MSGGRGHVGVSLWERMRRSTSASSSSSALTLAPGVEPTFLVWARQTTSPGQEGPCRASDSSQGAFDENVGLKHQKRRRKSSIVK